MGLRGALDEHHPKIRWTTRGLSLAARTEAISRSQEYEADALADLQRAQELGERYRGDLAIRAEVRFALARAMVATKGDAAQARALATRAAGELESVGLGESGKRVRQWLAAHQ